MNYVEINSQIIKTSDIKQIDLSNLISETINVILEDGTKHIVNGFDALEIIYLVHPSSLEGNNKIKFNKHMWAIHNLIAHPVMQLLAWCKQYKRAIWIHDITIPKPIGYKK